MYSYLKCIVYDKFLKPRQSFQITLYFFSYYMALFKLLFLFIRFREDTFKFVSSKVHASNP